MIGTHIVFDTINRKFLSHLLFMICAWYQAVINHSFVRIYVRRIIVTSFKALIILHTFRPHTSNDSLEMSGDAAEKQHS